MHRPAEIFTHTPESPNNEAKQAWSGHQCQYLGSTCVKKSQHELLSGRDLPFGVCSVYHRGEHLQNEEPHVICPRRFEQDDLIFKDAARLLQDPENFYVLREVYSGVGDFDYFVINYDEEANELVDFCALEVMTVSTTSTGGIIRSLLDHLDHDKKLEQDYNYGINYRQVLGRMESQLFLKGSAIMALGKRMVWAIQDVFWEYMLHNHPVDIAEGFDPEKPVGMTVYSLDGTPQAGYTIRNSGEYWGELNDWLSLLYPKIYFDTEDLENRLTKKLGEGHYKAFP